VIFAKLNNVIFNFKLSYVTNINILFFMYKFENYDCHTRLTKATYHLLYYNFYSFLKIYLFVFLQRTTRIDNKYTYNTFLYTIRLLIRFHLCCLYFRVLLNCILNHCPIFTSRLWWNTIVFIALVIFAFHLVFGKH